MKTRSWVLSLIWLAALFVGDPLFAQTERYQPPREREVREHPREVEFRRMVAENPTEWFRIENRLKAAEMDRLWTKLDPYTRRRVSEATGERQMEKQIETMGFERVCSTWEMSRRPQGFDEVVRRGNMVVVCESKATLTRSLDRLRAGGSLEGFLGTGYGHLQGTLEWAREAAHATLKSNTANARELKAADMVLDADHAGRLAVIVYVTRHDHGRIVDSYVRQTAGPRIP